MQIQSSRRAMFALATVFRSSGCFKQVRVDEEPEQGGRHTFTYQLVRSDYREVIDSALAKLGLVPRGPEESPSAWEIVTPTGVRLFTYGSDYGAVEP